MSKLLEDHPSAPLIISGFVSLSSIQDASGRDITFETELLRRVRAWNGPVPPWASNSGIPLGPNMFVDGGRQLLAYLFGGRSPSTSFSCSRFGIGTGSSAATPSYTALESPVNFYNGGAVKPVTSITYPEPYVVAVTMTLASGEANGVLITELGLFAHDSDTSTDVLLARKLLPVGFQKNSGETKTLTWNLRF